MKQHIFTLIVLLMTRALVLGQDTTPPKQKGMFFVYWGWNFDSYSQSDIHFKGQNYDFTLFDVKARGRQTPFSFEKYFRLDNLTIPQTNVRIGYFFQENYTISIGVDHMKYVMNNNQNVSIKGKIDTVSSFDGVYDHNQITLTEDFLTFEHTDGLNYVNVEVKRFDNISHWFGLHSQNFQINVTEGLGIGVLVPKTNTSLLGKKRYDAFHFSGYGASVAIGLNLTFFKYFFIQSDIKGGHIYMPDIRTTNIKTDTASQSFFFLENTIVFGGRFQIFKRR